MSLAEVLILGGENPLRAAWLLLTDFYLWALFIPALIYMIKTQFMFWRWNKYLDSLEYCLLAIDVPSNNEQGPLAVENFFAQIAGGHGSMTKWEKYWGGRLQAWFSFEIVSISGNIQFLIRTERKYRDLVEASIYAQYPDAEVTEVEDYTNAVPDAFPNDTHRLWGTEFGLSNDYCYPIKTYLDFEHSLSQEFKDPMSAFMETMSQIREGEHVWYQLIVTPIDHNTWREPCLDLLAKMSGQKVKKKGGLFGWLPALFDEPSAMIREFIRQIAGGAEDSADGKSASAIVDNTPIKVYAPTDIDTMKAVNRKISKIAFDVKIRLLYISPKESYNPSRVINSLVGAIKQFTELSLNSFKPELKRTGTRAAYFFTQRRINWKIRKILSAYRARSNYRGMNPMKLNIEEMATIYHFPTTFVKVPRVQQTASKKFDAPMNLPYDLPGQPQTPQQPGVRHEPIQSTRIRIPNDPNDPLKHEPPENLPV